MVDPFLKTHYRRGATDLMPEQIEEIRHLKNKVPTYMIVRDYHIRKERVHDIWNNCERSQQSKKYIMAEILSTDKKAEHSISDSSPANVVAHEPVRLSKPQDKQKKVRKQALSSKSTHLSDGSSEIVSGSIETKKESDPLALAPLASESSPNPPLIILQESKDVMELIKKSNIEMEKVRAKGRELKSKLTAGT
ncbi:hypothetical protein RhiirA4_472295 [Rhizophagus irregularis]|uniref:Uncharacterized protein n=1 Tax=Rhizophagus irregularis TaxID=588596 RepID=A0A2I1H4Q5_9GLOM|nr:hypothetical protein RhiirA4_472295 [Rhizophagus irregularis]